jgi:hypothetical protein
MNQQFTPHPFPFTDARSRRDIRRTLDDSSFISACWPRANGLDTSVAEPIREYKSIAYTPTRPRSLPGPLPTTSQVLRVAGLVPSATYHRQNPGLGCSSLTQPKALREARGGSVRGTRDSFIRAELARINTESPGECVQHVADPTECIESPLRLLLFLIGLAIDLMPQYL